VKPSCKNPAFFPTITLFFLGLAFCIFAWGMQYKLSLYDPPQAASHEMPKAKLLSKNERATVTENPLLKSGPVSGKTIQAVLVSVFLPLLLALTVFSPRAPINKEDWDSEQPWRLRIRASLNAFFFRPPPVLA
jgi:hypothetical protein